ncbi:MAG: hypothetical protein Q6K90_03655, partial [Gloeomargarita sp. HHBFW_bins_162]
FPCVSATAAVYRETNLGWTAFVAAWTTGMGYWVAVFYYQFMTWGQHPGRSTRWLITLFMVLIGVVWGLHKFGQRQRRLPLTHVQ